MAAPIPNASTRAIHEAARELRLAMLDVGELEAHRELSQRTSIPSIVSLCREIELHLEGPGPVVRHLATAARALASATAYRRCKNAPVWVARDLETMRAELAAAEAAWKMSRRSAA